ncbi:MAG: hypothetical protein ACRDV9_01315 [Acidimicrobiia bacterium]
MTGRDRRSAGVAKRSPRPSADGAAPGSNSSGHIYFEQLAVLRGAFGGTAAIAALSLLRVGVRQLSGGSAGGPWLVVFVGGILGAFLFSGRLAAGRVRQGQPIHGAIASLGALIGWVLLRSIGGVIGAGEGGFDVTVLAPAAIGAIVVGALGGAWRSRRSTRTGGQLP